MGGVWVGGGGVADEKGFSERASDSTPKSLNPPMLIDLFAFYKITDSVLFLKNANNDDEKFMFLLNVELIPVCLCIFNGR